MLELSHGRGLQGAEQLNDLLASRTAVVAVIGLGYVGLPLAEAVVSAGYTVVGFDTDPTKIIRLMRGESYLRHFSSDRMAKLLGGSFSSTTDFSRLAQADVVLICVPTPLTRNREPDLSFVEATARSVAASLRPEQLVVLESTSYPGTTSEVVRPILEAVGLQPETDFYLAYSPEREDPGNADFATTRVPKIVGADGELARALAELFYRQIFDSVITVPSSATAEAVKLTENVFRAVNIALVNELKVIFTGMGIDIWQVIDAAKTKPFGYMPFYPGPGLGGHCIPIDPFYLAWKAREYGITTRFIELAGEINTAMPRRVVECVADGLSWLHRKSLNGAKVLLIGIAYKKNIDDTRGSPALRVAQLLEERGCEVAFYDPFVDSIPVTREYPRLEGRRSIEFSAARLKSFDCAVVITDHDDIDYAMLEQAIPMLVDTRNVFERRGLSTEKVLKA